MPATGTTETARSSPSNQRFAHLWRMTPAERVAAMWRGDLSLGECLSWSGRHPEEVPLIGGELAYIVMRTPDWLGDDA